MVKEKEMDNAKYVWKHIKQCDRYFNVTIDEAQSHLETNSFHTHIKAAMVDFWQGFNIATQLGGHLVDVFSKMICHFDIHTVYNRYSARVGRATYRVKSRHGPLLSCLSKRKFCTRAIKISSVLL